MLKEAIEEIGAMAVAAVTPAIVEHEGRCYSAQQVHRIDPPAADAVHVATLASVVDFMETAGARDGIDTTKCVVHVTAARGVSVRGPLRGDRSRETFINACPSQGDAVGKSLNRFLPQEQMMMFLQQCFDGTPGREEVMKIVGNLQAEKARTLVDDGTTQEAIVKNGAVKTGGAVVKNPVFLVPKRTFPEVKLEAVPFILRFDGGGDGKMPTVALLECDNGAWELDAIAKIALLVKPDEDGTHAQWTVLS